MNVIIQRLNGLWHLIVGSCQIRTPFLETQDRELVVAYARRVYLAPRSSNAADGLADSPYHAYSTSCINGYEPENSHHEHHEADPAKNYCTSSARGLFEIFV